MKKRDVNLNRKVEMACNVIFIICLFLLAALICRSAVANAGAVPLEEAVVSAEDMNELGPFLDAELVEETNDAVGGSAEPVEYLQAYYAEACKAGKADEVIDLYMEVLGISID